jgi:hypothetical protein
MKRFEMKFWIDHSDPSSLFSFFPDDRISANAVVDSEFIQPSPTPTPALTSGVVEQAAVRISYGSCRIAYRIHTHRIITAAVSLSTTAEAVHVL